MTFLLALLLLSAQGKTIMGRQRPDAPLGMAQATEGKGKGKETAQS
jgi:hypothetical protein